MENLQETSLYKNHDFYLSAICLAAGLSLLRLERGQGKFVVFVFSDPQQKAQQIISDHWSHKLKVPSRSIIEAINELKTRLHSGV
ncbi:hypothetical protein HY384_02000 [Candidatus Daviesbacteria bacterium]|nr:hypothetical protein [Candidatus Daviesbacteria bacterium]